MKDDIKRLTVSLLVLGLCTISVLPLSNNGNLLLATDQLTTSPTFSLQGTIIPLTVINPITDEYILSGTWNMDVKEE